MVAMLASWITCNLKATKFYGFASIIAIQIKHTKRKHTMSTTKKSTATAKRSVGRPAIMEGRIVFTSDENSQKFNAIRMDQPENVSDPLLKSIYLNRAGVAMLGLPKGHVPTKVELVVRVLKHEAIAAPVPAKK
jgi:hypothetical protein